MKFLIIWFIRNPVTANLLMMILIMAGFLALPNIHQEEFPTVEVEAVQIKVPYLGAAPAEVEEGVCIRIEEAIEGTEGVDRVLSTAAEGFCQVVAELVPGVDKSRTSNIIKSKVDAIDSFPGETEKPVTAEITLLATVLEIAIWGNADERTLKVLGQNLRDELAGLREVSQVELLYSRPYEMSIEVSEQTLRRHGLTLQQVGQAIERSSLDVPGGSLRTESGEIMLRTKGQAYRGKDFENIVVLTHADGTQVRVADLAQVVDGFEDAQLRARFDGNPAVAIKVSRVGEEDILAIADAVKQHLDDARQRAPEGIEYTIWKDESQDLVDRLDTLTRNARSGLILVLLILTLFLRFRLALWVAAGIPVAMLGTVSMFPLAGVSISTVSVMAFILVLGILVDDAIVVGERIYAHEQQGKSQVDAAIAGTQEVSTPVVFGVLTTMATFIPVMNVPGTMGGFFTPLGVVAIIALAFSIIESQFILPSHLAHRKAERQQGGSSYLNGWLKIQDRISNGMQNVANHYYEPAVSLAIRWRYLTLAIGVVMLILTAALFMSGRMVFQFFPSVEGTRLYATLTMPEGTPISVTLEAAQRIEAAAEQLRLELDENLEPDEDSKIRHVFSSVGQFIPKGSTSFTRSSPESHKAEIGVELNLPRNYSGTPTAAHARRWRELTGQIPDAVELGFTSEAFGMGSAIDIELAGRDFDELRSAAAELREVLQGFDGVQDLSDTFRAGKQEVQLSLKPEARALGLTLADLGQQVRQAFYGYEAQRLQRGKDDIRVMVRYPEDERRSLGNLETMRIRTPEGIEVPFATVADAEISRGYTTIKRVDGSRVVRVFGDVDRSISTPEAIVSQVIDQQMRDILDRHPGVTFRLAGEQEERAESMGGLIATGTLALIIIYALLAIPLQSYLQPLVIMSVIPFGAVGAIFGHLVTGKPLVFFSLLGIVALSGVVVNSSLVLVDYINRQRRSGQSLEWVVAHAGAVRFRPIVLTSVTTFVGLTPLMTDNTISLSMFVPMAVSLSFGVLIGTAITLFLVPCLYLVLEDFLALFGNRNSEPAARNLL